MSIIYRPALAKPRKFKQYFINMRIFVQTPVEGIT